MTPGTAKRSLRFIESFAASSGAASFDIGMFGREPLMEPELVEEIVRLSRGIARLHTVSLNTNGTLLTRPMLRMLEEGGVRIALSLDGAPATHDRARAFPDGAGSFSAIAAVIGDLAGLSVPVNVRMTVTPASAGLLRENVAFVFGLGFKSVSFFCDLTAEWSAGALEAFRVSLAGLVEWYTGEILSGREIRLPAFDSALAAREVPAAGLFCGAARSLFSIATDGTIYPCWRFAGDPAMAMGDVRGGFRIDHAEHPFNKVDQRKLPRCGGCRHASVCRRCAWVSIKTGGSMECVTEAQCLTSMHVVEAGMESCRRIAAKAARGRILKDGTVSVTGEGGTVYNVPASIMKKYAV
jgi:uncharacterized protein